MKKVLYIVNRLGIHEERFSRVIQKDFELVIIAIDKARENFIKNFEEASLGADLIMAGPLTEPIASIPVNSTLPVLGICHAFEVNECRNQKELETNVSRCKAIVTDSEYITNKLRNEFNYHNPIYQFHYGCDWENFSKLKPSFQEKISIVVLRNWDNLYQNEVILEVLSELNGRGISFECTFIGSGPNLTTGKALSQEYGIQDKVSFMGKMESQELPKIMATHWIYLSAARSDGISVSLLEALSLGLICLTTNFPTNQFLTDNGIGQTFELDNKSDLIDKILTLAELTSQEKDKMSLSARNFAREHAQWSENAKSLSNALIETTGL
jgi:glycosyltransferase involved in cell wall biosynthesis